MFNVGQLGRVGVVGRYMCLFIPPLSSVRLLCTVENNNTTVYTVPSDYSFKQNSRTTKMTSSYKQ